MRGFLLIVFSIQTLSLNANSIAEADSLFQSKKYTESFEIYRDILTNRQLVSPAMLLKMAYIKEGLGNKVEALYYLNLYYVHTADKKALEKLQTLSEKFDVEGYEFSDFEYVQTLFFKHFEQINYLLLAAGILLLSLVYYLKMIKKVSPAVPAFFMVIILVALFYTINFGKEYSKAIVKEKQAYLMSGPSSAAEVLVEIKRGVRVNTKDQTDVWTKVETDQKIGYIKTDKLRFVAF